MKGFVKEIKNIYDKMSVFQVENDANGEVLTRDELMLHSIHLVQRWAEIETALNSISNIKVDPKYESVPFGVESNDGLLDYIQVHYPMIYNEACNDAFEMYDCENVLEFEKSE